MTVSSVGSSTLMQQLQQALFKTADTNNDGQLSSDEFTALGKKLQGEDNTASSSTTLASSTASQNFSSDMLSSLLSMQQDQTARADKMFASADSDGDGKVTATELTADISKHMSADGASSTDSADSTKAADIAAQMIKDGDTDGDGTLSKTEMEAMKPHGGHHGGGMGGPGGPPPADASASSSSSSSSTTYDPADTNKDGTVSSDELIASLQAAASSATSSMSASNSYSLLSQMLSQLTGTSSSTGSTVAVAA